MDLDKDHYFVTFPRLYSITKHGKCDSSRVPIPPLDRAKVGAFRAQLTKVVQGLVGARNFPKAEWGHFIVSHTV